MEWIVVNRDNRLAIFRPDRQTWAMIFMPTIIEQLRERWDEVQGFEQERRVEWEEYAAGLERLAHLSWAEILEVVREVENPGAIPTREVDLSADLRFTFGKVFQNHGEARGWAAGVLSGQPIVAVDGSQIPPPPELGFPLAGVQAAWFENHHTADGRYERQIEFELLTPSDLRSADENGEWLDSDQIINLRRFELEFRTLGRRLNQLASNVSEGRLPLGLIDSSLVISFADRLSDEWRRRYVGAVLDLLRTSEETGIPVIGYIDGSRSRDLLRLLEVTYDLPPAQRLNDASLLASRLPWGARTPLMICARGGADRRHQGVLEEFAEYRRRIGFVYLRTGSSPRLARLEIPAWVWERGLLDRVIDLVRAEVIVGNGYPYAIQSADAAAAVSGRDREQFEGIVRRFNIERGERGIETGVSAKAVSKMRRR